jgi:hypothetical protein
VREEAMDAFQALPKKGFVLVRLFAAGGVGWKEDSQAFSLSQTLLVTVKI